MHCTPQWCFSYPTASQEYDCQLGCDLPPKKKNFMNGRQHQRKQARCFREMSRKHLAPGYLRLHPIQAILRFSFLEGVATKSCVSTLYMGCLQWFRESGKKRHERFIVNPTGKCPLSGRVVSDYNPTSAIRVAIHKWHMYTAYPACPPS